MAKRLHAEFFSQNGTEYDIELYDSSFVGTSQEVITHDLQIRWESEGDMPLEPLKASKASFSIVNNSAAVDSFLTSMKSSNEDDIQMVIRKDGSLFWAGVVLIDLLSWADTPKNRVVTIQAIDGIGRLKDIPFEWASDVTNPDTNTLLKYIYEILEYNNLSQYWGASDAYIYESCEFYDTQITTPASTDSPFLLTRAERTLFLTNEVNAIIQTNPLYDPSVMNRPGYRPTWQTAQSMKPNYINEYKPISCGDALSAIMQLMCCRIMISDGAYHIQQLRNFENSTYTQRKIVKALTVSSATSFSHRQTEGTDVKRAGGGVWTYLPPLNLATVLYTPPPTLRYDGGAEEDLDASATPVTRTINIGTIRGGSGTGRKLKVWARIRNKKAFPWPNNNNTEVTIDIQIKCGNYRLKSTNSAKYLFEWTNGTLTDKVTRTYLAGRKGDWTFNKDLEISFETPEIPFTKETGCTIDFTYSVASINSSAAKGEFTIKPEAVVTLIESERNLNALFEVNNPNTQNSKRIDFGNLGLVDRDDPSTANNIEIYDGSSWEESGLWDCGYPNDYTLHQGVAMEAVSLQRTPNDVFQGPIFVPASYSGKDCVYPHMTYYYDTTTYWFNGGTWICNHDRMQGEWVQYTFNSGSMAPVENKENQRGPDNPDDWVGERIKQPWEYDKDWMNDGEMAIVKDTLSGATTSIPVISLTKDIRDGDTLSILDPVTNTVVETCTVNGNQTSGATSITVNSFTPSADVGVGAYVAWDKKDLRESEVIRAKDYLITINTTVPTAGSPIGADGAILNPDDGKLYYQSSGNVYSLTGTLLT